MTEAPWQYQNSLGLDVTTQCYDCSDACLWYSMVRSSKTTDSQGGTVFLLISAFQWISSALQAWWTVAGRCLDMVPGLLWCFWSCVKVLAMHYVDPCCFDRRCTHDQTDWLERGAKHCAQDMIVDNASWMRISQQFFKTKHTWKFHEIPNLMKDLNLSYLIMF